MSRQILSVLLAVFLVVLGSCATTGEEAQGEVSLTAAEDSGNGEDLTAVEFNVVAEEASDDAASETGTGDAGVPSAELERTVEKPAESDTTEIASAIEKPREKREPKELEPLPPPELQVVPENPETEEAVSIMVDSSGYDRVAYDFGDGATEEATYTYTSFGAKTVTVTVFSENRSGSAQVTFPVRGTAVLHLEKNEVEHDASWKPLIEAELEADGDFDTLVVYERGRPVLEMLPPEEYVIPVPFVGERVFTAALFHQDFYVADVGEVSITGLNSPPQKPVYGGEQFIFARVGDEVSFKVNASDPNNNPVRYQVRFEPEGARFDEATGVFAWTPTREQRGVYLIHFIAFDIPYDFASPFTQRGIVVQ